MTRYTLTFKRFACPSCGGENLVQPMELTNTLAEDLELLTPEMLEEIIRINGCCPRFNNTPPRFFGSTGEDAPPEPSVVDRLIPAFLRKQPANR